MEQTSLSYLFFTFLKLGATAFGGYMSLVAIVQKQLVEIDKKLKEDDLLNGISLTAVLPGPVAVNTIAYVGYHLRGIPGAMVAVAGIIIPACLLVIFLSWIYFSYGSIPTVKHVFNGITPAITALIITVAIGMTRKTIHRTAQWFICLLAALLLIGMGGFATTLLLIIGSGVAGCFLFRQPVEKTAPITDKYKPAEHRFLLTSGIGLLLLLCILLWGGQYPGAPKELQLISTFSGISLTLFGGGYVVIPALHELFVDNLHWLTSAEFADGIAIGQSTPGPIFITATFIGYKVGGIAGALLATLAMFTPPAVLTILCARFVMRLNQSPMVKAAMSGIRAAVIGMIYASAVTIGQTITLSVASVSIFLLTFLISLTYNISPVFLIIGAGIAGFILH